MDFAQIRRLVIIAMFSDDVLLEKLILKGGNALRLVHDIGSRTSMNVDQEARLTREAAVPPIAIRRLSAADREAALTVVNEAARWYREFLPPGEYHEPEMTADDWDREARRLTWYGVFVAGVLVGVGGLKRVRDAALLRHGYVLPAYQRRGIGARLIEHLESEARGVDRIIVGTYRDNSKAHRALEKAGYGQSSNPEEIMRAYYAIPEDRLRSSVTYEKTLPARSA